MKTLISLALLAISTPLAAANAPQHLAGVSDEETTISGSIRQYHRGNGDVVFVLDQAGRWYRVGLNEGCLKATPRIFNLSFDVTDGVSRIDRFTRVLIDQGGGTLQTSCKVDSIRRSEAPPQVDSKSPVTLD